MVLKAAPRTTKRIQSGWLVFESRGPVCFIQPRTRHVNLGFWRGAQLPDPGGALAGTGRHMRPIKIRDVEDIDPHVIQDLVRAGAGLHRDVPHT